ncbi:MAG: hypothetical protein ACYTFA_11590 [Planctomycetota bacterium]|jgi:hypothetical protein
MLLQQVHGLVDAFEREDHRASLAMLRDYVYRTVVWSNDGLRLNHYCGGDLRRLTLEEIVRLFEAREIGVLCGGTAVFLAKVYEQFGYHASWFDYGIPGVSTHVVTVVTVPTECGPRPVIQDATFNSTPALSGTADPSFFDVLQCVAAGRADGIALNKGAVQPRTVCFSDTPQGHANIAEYTDAGILLEKPVRIISGLSGSGLFYARGDLDFHTSYLRRNGGPIRARLSKELDKPENKCNVLELMLFPLQLPVFKDTKLRERTQELVQLFNDFQDGTTNEPSSIVRTAN